MDRCVCRKQTFHEYRDDDENLLGVNCTSCGQEWLKESRNRRERIIFQGQEMGKYAHEECVDNGLLMTKPERTPITRRNMNTLREGDHITWLRTYGIWHHAIILKTFSSGHIEVCHFDSDNERSKAKAIIKTKVMHPLMENGVLYRIEYSNIPEENSAAMAVARAKVYQSMSAIGSYCYHFFGNNCENFATFCKTGFSISYQLEWLKSKVEQSIDVGIYCGKNPEVRNMLFQCRIALYEAIEAVTGAGNALGAGLLTVGEIYMCYKDICKINSQERLPEEERKLEKNKRVSECVGGVLFGAVGSYALGQLIGSTLGSLIGGTVGLFAGKIIGAFVGGQIGAW